MSAVPFGAPNRVGPYALLFAIGSGGAATVFLARREDRLFALKLTHAHLHAGGDRGKMIVREARLAARARHPNVVAIVDASYDPSGAYLVMEYVEGNSLAGLSRTARRAGEKIPRDIGLGILCQALDGLHAAHELRDENGEPLGVVHRDVSPHNVLVGIDGVARLTDFGIAKSFEHETTTESGFVKGKFGYMAPEQLRGHRVDRRADIWAGGVIAWELCTNERLFGEGDPVQIMLRLATEKPRRASALASDVSPALDRAIATALEVDPTKRHATAEELATAIRDATPVADAGRIAAFVARLCEDDLAERRARIDAQGSDGDARTQMTATASTTSNAPPLRRSVRAALAACAATAFVISGAMVARRWHAPPATATAPRETPDTTVPVLSSAAPVPSPERGSAAAPEPSASPSDAPSAERGTKPPPKPTTDRAQRSSPGPSLLDNPYRNP